MKNLNLIQLLVILIISASCTSEINNNEILTSTEKEIISSPEYQNLMADFNSMSIIEDEIHENFQDALKNGITDEKELTDFYLDLINPEKDVKSIAYLGKIGITSPEELLQKRRYLFDEKIPTAMDNLGEKYPQFEQYSVEQLVKLRETYKEQYLAL